MFANCINFASTKTKNTMVTKKIKNVSEFVDFLKKEYAKNDITFSSDGFDEGMWSICFEYNGISLYGDGILSPAYDGELSDEEYENNLDAYYGAFSHFVEGGTESFVDFDTDSEEEYDRVEDAKSYISEISDYIYEKLSELI